MSYSKKYMNSERELVNFRGNVFKKKYKTIRRTRNYFKFWGSKENHFRRVSFLIHRRHDFVNGVQFLDMFDVSNTKCGRAYSKKSEVNKQKY